MSNFQELPKNEILAFQRHEANGAMLYKKLARINRSPENKKILNELAKNEWQHYLKARAFTGINISENKLKVQILYLVARIFGLVFCIKLLEYNAKREQQLFCSLKSIPEYQNAIEEGEHKEKLLINEIDEERLYYMSSVVLGLNDALIEFTGALAGFAFAFQNHKIVAMAGAITGIAAALSMGASEYMSTQTETQTKRNARKAAIYTFITYLITVILLIMPFIILSNVYMALLICLLTGAMVVGAFNFYYAVTRNENFWKRFLGMISVSLSVATISFMIGWLLKHFTGINI